MPWVSQHCMVSNTTNCFAIALRVMNMGLL